MQSKIRAMNDGVVEPEVNSPTPWGIFLLLADMLNLPS